MDDYKRISLLRSRYAKTTKALERRRVRRQLKEEDDKLRRCIEQNNELGGWGVAETALMSTCKVLAPPSNFLPGD